MFLFNLIKNLLFFTGSYSNNVFPDPLSLEEEERCIDKMLQGDEESRNRLIEHNLRLIAHIVKKFETKEQDADDLISIGTIGLIKGVDSYNKEKATRITTYVARCIENEILMYFRGNKKNNNNVSLNDSIGYDKDGNEINLIDIIKDNNIDMADSLHTKNNIELLNSYLKKLNTREQEIITKRYGLNLMKEQTQKEIAKELGISRSYVSRIEKRALTKILKEFIKSKNNL
ncbi:MAG: RNA polymerase sporulation sigma factor SigK [Bacilli bacterium]|jgi:RNA polymerase sporulation-specific sigma factor|nr:RNA polymerase sporulation sigma factor SigK [Bacilli bacterium]